MTNTTVTTTDIPGYRAGNWTIDPAHSEVGFSVRHMMISKVRGKFEDFTATFTTGDDPLESSVTASAQVASVSTGDENRDNHLRTNDFFSAPEFPTIEFVSTGVRAEGGDYKVDGDLTIKGTTKQVTFDFDFGGIITDQYGKTRGGATASTTISRSEFGLTWNPTLETGGVVVGDAVALTLSFEAVLDEE